MESFVTQTSDSTPGLNPPGSLRQAMHRIERSLRGLKHGRLLLRIARWSSGAFLAGLVFQIFPTLGRASLDALRATRTWLVANVGPELIATVLVFTALMLVPAASMNWRRWLSFRNHTSSLLLLVGSSISLAIGNGPLWAALFAGLAALCWPWPHRPFDVEETRDLEAPILGASEDLFHRDRFVRFVAAQLTLHGARCPRVAIQGAVGTGKTSVANLVRERLEADGHLVVRFDPWHHRDRASCREALLTAIEDAMLPRPRYKGVLVRQRLFLWRVWLKLVDQLAWIELLGSQVERRLALGQDELGAELRAALPDGKRLVVFVDDLERCAADVALDLLMNVKEIVNAPGLAYLLTFDDTRLAERVKRAEDAFPGEDPAHLDKVIDLRFILPAPLPEDQREARRRFGAVWTQLAERLDAIEAIACVLPSSLRDQKRFLLFAAARLSDLPTRPEWLRLDDRFLLALLLVEFLHPGFLDIASASDAIQAELDSGVLRAALRSTLDPFSGADSAVSGEAGTAFVAGSEPGQSAYARATQIGNEAHNSRGHIAWIRGEGPADDEWIFQELARHLVPGAGVADLVPNLAQQSSDRLSVMITAASRVRERLLEIVVEAPTAAAQEECFALMGTIEAAREAVLDELLRRRIEPGQDLFTRSIGSLSRWGQFGGPYVPHLRCEANLAVRLAQHAGSGAMNFLLALDQRPSVFDPPGFAKFRSRLEHLLADRASDRLEALFSEPNGMGIVAQGGSNVRESRFIFDLKSAFYSPERCERLVKLAEGSNVDVRHNLISYFVSLHWRSETNVGFGPRQAGWLAKIWSLVVKEPINRRLMGEVVETRKFLISRGLEEASFPFPPWWQPAIAEHEQRLDWEAIAVEIEIPQRESPH